LFKKGLAYKKEMSVNWCTSCKVVLANEEVINGTCERCHSDVIRKNKSQWMLKITDYAEKLLEDLSDLDYPERVKITQSNWIGKSKGASVTFKTTANYDLEVYTTRPDTLFGATYMVISPEHPLAHENIFENPDEIAAYQAECAKKSDFDRTEMNKDKTGVELKGIKAVNPTSGEEIPVFISDYVLMSYGTGAIMAVPAHDTRDYEFAKKFGLTITEVVAGGDIEKEAFTDCATGVMVNSGFLNGLTVDEAKVKITEFLENEHIGESKINYKLRDWVFSRQRYWGEPIPIVNCPECGYVPIDESELPLELPDVLVEIEVTDANGNKTKKLVSSFEPTENGESPLSKMHDWVNCKCPQCGQDAKRETDTMPQWAGSSWYFLRYCDPENSERLAGKEALNYWLPVDWYNGGMEHTTLHLLYSRFWHKFLYDIGKVPTREPYAKRTSHGMILGEDMQKMSKSRGNVINPEEVIDEYGADTLRLYEMFVGDFEKAAPWSKSSIKGCKRFLERVWALSDILSEDTEIRSELLSVIHKTIKKVSDDTENLKFNTAISSLMSLTNEFYASGSVTREELNVLLTLLNPFAPHITEEMYYAVNKKFLNEQTWCDYDEKLCKDSEIEIVIQISGKLRGKIVIPVDSDKESVLALAREKVAVSAESVVKEIYVPNKLVNFVVKKSG
jgi:leucyl-tRNA synthetase